MSPKMYKSRGMLNAIVVRALPLTPRHNNRLIFPWAFSGCRCEIHHPDMFVTKKAASPKADDRPIAGRWRVSRAGQTGANLWWTSPLWFHQFPSLWFCLDSEVSFNFPNGSSDLSSLMRRDMTDVGNRTILSIKKHACASRTNGTCAEN